MSRVWELHAEQLLRVYDVDSHKGLSPDEVAARIAKHGRNMTDEIKKVPAWRILVRQFKSFIIYVLLAAALISFLIGNHLEFIVISCIVAFIILLSFLEEFKATRDMEALRQLTPRKARALRGTEQELAAAELVPGDIILLRRGDLVPADARVLEAMNLRIDESTLTGESVPVSKKALALRGAISLAEQVNMVFAGSKVTDGAGTCLVVRTGKETEIGKIASLLADVGEQDTPLQQKLDKLGKQFSLGVMVICLLIFLLGLFRGQPWEALLLLAVSVAVSGIPESLPAVIAVALSIGIKRMAAQNAIVKKLSAVETLGTCTVICTDKTGTLTQNKMVVEHVYTYHHEVDVTGQGLSPKGLFLRENVRIDPNRHKGVAKMLEIGLLCNNAALLRKEGAWHIDGESTEGALIVLAQKAGLSREDAHERCPRVKEHPFDAERKCMSAVHMLRKQPLVYAKGAPEILLAKCDRYYDNGRVHRMTASVRQHYLEKTQAYASQGKRVLGLAFKEHKGKSYELRHVESQLVFAGLVAMRDPPEAGAKEAVAECHAAGTLVVMITGDNRDTALAIAQELGIHRRGDGVLSGPELDDLDDNKFSQLVGHTTVYARTTPKHKMRIVSALQEQGHIVAMTGDGVNDAPALRKADIGVAMGRTGTDVAKEAADMVIKDDNFRTIVTAIREGRTIYTNIRRFIYYLLAGNFSEVILILIAALLGVAPVLTPIMILFVNLVTSDIPALGLCMERPGRHIMHQRPRDPQEKILNEYLFLKISQVVPLIVVGTIGLFIYELAFLHQSLPHAQTVALASLVCFELFHVLNARSFTHSSLEGYNPSVLWGIVLSAMALLTVIYAPYFQGIFGTVPLEPASWVRIVLVSSSVLLLVELQKTFLAAEMNERDKLALQQRAT